MSVASAPLLSETWEIFSCRSKTGELLHKVEKDVESFQELFGKVEFMRVNSNTFLEVQLYTAIKRYRHQVKEFKRTFSREDLDSLAFSLGSFSSLYKKNPYLEYKKEEVRVLDIFVQWWDIFEKRYRQVTTGLSEKKVAIYDETIKTFFKKSKIPVSETFINTRFTIFRRKLAAQRDIELFQNDISDFFKLGETHFEIYNNALVKLAELVEKNREESLPPFNGVYGLNITNSQEDDSLEKMFYSHLLQAYASSTSTGTVL